MNDQNQHPSPEPRRNPNRFINRTTKGLGTVALAPLMLKGAIMVAGGINHLEEESFRVDATVVSELNTLAHDEVSKAIEAERSGEGVQLSVRKKGGNVYVTRQGGQPQGEATRVVYKFKDEGGVVRRNTTSEELGSAMSHLSLTSVSVDNGSTDERARVVVDNPSSSDPEIRLGGEAEPGGRAEAADIVQGQIPDNLSNMTWRH